MERKEKLEFKEILSEYLQTKNLTQVEFAKVIGVKQSQVSEWLRGKAKPSYDIMREILSNCDYGADFWFDIK